MILLIDAGNSRIKWGLWQNGVWQSRGALPTLELDQFAEVLGNVEPAWIGICCVAGETVREGLKRTLGKIPVTPFWLNASQAAFGVRNGYAQSEALGADRFANLIACHALGLAPCLVVSLGTAVTIDALTAAGEFRGGVILPGLGLMRQSLLRDTAGVNKVAGEVCAYPACTGDGVESGIVMAVVGAIEQFRARFEADEGCKVEVVLTGGDWAKVAAKVSSPQRQIQDLVLEGLVWVARGQGVQGI